MPRNARIVIPGVPHHITQRGNNKQQTFLCADDYIHYLNLLEKNKTRYGLDIYSYCLMPNHIHLKVVPHKNDSMAKVLNTCQMSFCQYFNRKYNRVGHLWQSRFFSCPLDEKHVYSVTKYIENNPVRAGLVTSAADWEWSSAKEHLGIKNGMISLSPIRDIMRISSWKKYLSEHLNGNEIHNIEKHLYNGTPLGDSGFIDSIEILLGIPLKKRPVGRPPKKR